MVDGGRYQEICDNLIVELQEKTESNERLLLPNSGVPCLQITRKNVLIKLWSTDYQQDSHKTITQQKKAQKIAMTLLWKKLAQKIDLKYLKKLHKQVGQ